MSRVEKLKSVVSEGRVLEIYRNISYTINKKESENIKNIRELKSILGCSINEMLDKIINTNPFLNGYKVRSEYREEDRVTLSSQSRVNYKFCEVGQDDKNMNKSETSIQRHIFLSDKYESVLGCNVYYEFPLSYDVNTGAIDLITYDKDNNILRLIEFKKCASNRNNNKKSNEKASDEILMRAVFEVTTYYSFFVHLISDIEARKSVESAFKTVSGLDIDLIKVKVVPTILAPISTYIFDTERALLPEIYEYFSIEANRSLSEYTINSKEKLFDISRVK